MTHPRSSIVKVSHLSHRYSEAWAIRDINFDIDQHGVTGLLGSNGAGKSTTMNILCGALKQTEGSVLIEGLDVRDQPEQAKRRLGFLPQNPPLYLDFTVDEYLVHCAHLRQMPKSSIPAALKSTKDRCGITHVSRRLIGNLSGGYRQRCGIAQAIIHRPSLVVLDEPTNGLDPNQILEVRTLIREIAEDQAILFSTHILPEVQATCRSVIMIEGGRIVFDDSLQSFNNYLEPRSLLLTFAAPPPAEGLRQVTGITAVQTLGDRAVRLQFDGSENICERLIECSVAQGWRLQEISVEKSSLDSVFKHLSALPSSTQS